MRVVHGKENNGVKRLCAASLALLLLLAALPSCTVTFSGGTGTTAAESAGVTESAPTEAETTDGAAGTSAETTAEETEAPVETTAPETEAPPEQTDDEYTKNY